MTIPRSVLVPVDGSNFAEHALPYALGIARRTGSTLHLALVHVPAESVSPTYPLSKALQAHYSEQRDQEAEYLQRLVGRLERSGVPLHPVLLRGRVFNALSDYVESADIDLIVMTTHGRGGFQRTWLGSTADSLIRHVMVPLLLLRPSEATRDIGPDSDRTVRHAVVALDGSGTAETALHDALELGITRDASMTLLHVLQPTGAMTAPYLPQGIHIGPDELEERKSHMLEYLNRMAESAALHQRGCETRVALDYHPAPAVLELAEEKDADLIVLGTHGRSGLRRLILGSVADKVIRGTHRPVLVHWGVGRIAHLVHLVDRPHNSEQAGSSPRP